MYLTLWLSICYLSLKGPSRAKSLENHMQEMREKQVSLSNFFIYTNILYTVIDQSPRTVSTQEISHSVVKNNIIVASFNFEVPHSIHVFFLSFQIPQNWTCSVVSSRPQWCFPRIFKTLCGLQNTQWKVLSHIRYT